MKTKYFCFLLLISLTILTLTASQTARADDKDKAIFKMTQSAPNVFRVVGVNMNGSAYHAGFGDAFEEAIKVISSKYKILSINPINYVYQTGSITEEIYVIIDDKK